MVCETKPWLVLLHLLLVLAANYMQQCVHGEPQVPCLFIFGDSLSDSGNNNNLVTSAKSNYKPYGIDFPAGPTGRFTNGRTAIDIITQLLGFQNLIPPFANIGSSDILQGVNYASGAAGIRVESGTHLGADISLGSQLINHKIIVSQIAAKLGGVDKAGQYLNKCLYYVNIGSNDYINNYFLPQFYQSSRLYNPEQYAIVLIQQLSSNLNALHDTGARKVMLVALGSIGCIPNAMRTHGKIGKTCVDEENVAAFIFNAKLKSLVDQLNNLFSAESKYIFVNTTAGTLDLALGFTVLTASCCKAEANGKCVADQMPCLNRQQHVFFDEFHPTEAVNQLSAIATYNASNPSFTYPMDILHLVQL